MAVLAVTRPSLAGTPLAMAAPSVDGDAFLNTGQESLFVVNSAAVERTIVFASPGTCSFGVAHAAHAVVVAVPPGGRLLVGPFATTRFNDTFNRVNFTVDAVADLTVAVMV